MAVCSAESYRRPVNLSTWAKHYSESRACSINQLLFFLSFTLFLHTMLRPGADCLFCFLTEVCAVPENRLLEELLEIVWSVVNIPNAVAF